MPTVTLTREDGKLTGLNDRDRRAYAKFKKRLETMGPKESLSFSWKEPRNPKHHRLVFLKFNALLDIQEQFDDVDDLRKWITVGAGYCDLVPGPYGKAVALPKSLNWERMEEPEFIEFHERMDAFLRSQHACNYLWGHLRGDQQAEMVEIFLKGFEKE